MANYYQEWSFEIVDLSRESYKILLQKMNEYIAEDTGEDIDDIFSDNGLYYDNDEKRLVSHNADGDADLDAIVYGLVHMTKDYPDHDPIVITYSGRCDRPRIDAFGGGAVIIHKGEEYAQSAYSWAANKVSELTESN